MPYSVLLGSCWTARWYCSTATSQFPALAALSARLYERLAPQPDTNATTISSAAIFRCSCVIVLSCGSIAGLAHRDTPDQPNPVQYEVSDTDPRECPRLS